MLYNLEREHKEGQSLEGVREEERESSRVCKWEISLSPKSRIYFVIESRENIKTSREKTYSMCRK